MALMEKRSMKLDGHRTSVALEPEFWVVVERAALLKGESLPKYIATVGKAKPAERNLASALRLEALRLASVTAAA